MADGLHRSESLDRGAEGLPRIRIGQRVIDHGGALREMPVEHLGEQRPSVREVPVQRRHADPGPARDCGHRDVEPTPGEHLARGIEDALPVPPGVSPRDPRRIRSHPSHLRPSLPAGVARVRQDDGDGAECPGPAGSVPVAVRVGSGRAETPRSLRCRATLCPARRCRNIHVTCGARAGASRWRRRPSGGRRGWGGGRRRRAGGRTAVGRRGSGPASLARGTSTEIREPGHFLDGATPAGQ